MTHVDDEKLTSELLPCPFCGAALERSEFHSTRSVERRTHPAGSECILQGIIISMDDRPDDVERRAAWNHRSLGKADGVGVKALEWMLISETRQEHIAVTVFGNYSVEVGRDGGFLVSYEGHFIADHRWPTLEAAEAAAQADFNTRILSALTAALQPSGSVK